MSRPVVVAVSPTSYPQDAMKEPRKLAAALAKVMPRPHSSSGHLGGWSRSPTTSAAGAASRSRRVSAVSPTDAPTAAVVTNVLRQPSIPPMVGTASPPSMIASGTADCLTPNPSPRRPGGSARAMDRLATVWQQALPRPSTAMVASSDRGPRARVAMSTPPVATRTPATTCPSRAPARSTNRPASTDPTAATAKKVLTATPNMPSPILRSSRTQTACAPIRKGGRAPRVVNPEAAAISRRLRRPSSCRPAILTGSG